MKNRFDFRRFVQVLRLSWQTQPVLPYILLIAFVPLLYIYFISDIRNSGNVAPQRNYFSLGLYMAFCFYFYSCGWLYAGMICSEFGKQGAATRYLLLPASTLEKWLAKSVLALLVFPLICWLTYNLAFKGFEWLSMPLFTFRFEDIDWGSWEMQMAFYFFFLSLPVAYASGLIWKRFGVLKGLVFMFILFFILFQFIQWVHEQHPYDSNIAVLLQEVKPPFFDLKNGSSIQQLNHIFWSMAFYVPSLLLLASTYFFMKEKEL